MKKLLAIAAAAAAVFTLTPTHAEAGYKSRLIGKCQHCHGSIYSYYKPVRYSDGCTRFAWVPSYHTSCSSRNRYSGNGYTNRSYYRPTYRAYSGPGVSIQFGRSYHGYNGYRGGGYCR